MVDGSALETRSMDGVALAAGAVSWWRPRLVRAGDAEIDTFLEASLVAGPLVDSEPVFNGRADMDAACVRLGPDALDGVGLLTKRFAGFRRFVWLALEMDAGRDVNVSSVWAAVVLCSLFRIAFRSTRSVGTATSSPLLSTELELMLVEDVEDSLPELLLSSLA